uniref:Uncharacterized protein n=1 Tax=Setaria viridis TaxID=4556 RepID=A0A4U6WHJ5_SETVI|nr:hypothetical protein SEVIR_1G304250v2 [Setaria viridis]
MFVVAIWKGLTIWGLMQQSLAACGTEMDATIPIFSFFCVCS